MQVLMKPNDIMVSSVTINVIQLKGRFNGIRITEMIKLFYKGMLQLNILKACFDQSFFQNKLFLFVHLSGLLVSI
jgi:hypothetical protein